MRVMYLFKDVYSIALTCFIMYILQCSSNSFPMTMIVNVSYING